MAILDLFFGFCTRWFFWFYSFSVLVFTAVCEFCIFQHLVFGFCLKHWLVFRFGIQCGFQLFLFRFWFHFHLSSNYVPPLISNRHETSNYVPLVTTALSQKGFWLLGCENWSVLTVLHMGIGFVHIVLQFCSLGCFFFYGFVVSKWTSILLSLIYDKLNYTVRHFDWFSFMIFKGTKVYTMSPYINNCTFGFFII